MWTDRMISKKCMYRRETNSRLQLKKNGKRNGRWQMTRREARRGQTMNTIGKIGGERVKEMERRMKR